MVRADRVDSAAPEGRRSSARAASSSRTSIWAVLYHAGINDKFSISSAATAWQRRQLRSEQPVLGPRARVCVGVRARTACFCTRRRGV